MSTPLPRAWIVFLAANTLSQLGRHGAQVCPGWAAIPRRQVFAQARLTTQDLDLRCCDPFCFKVRRVDHHGATPKPILMPDTTISRQDLVEQ